MSPRRGAWLIAIGRVVIGASVLAAPEPVMSRWLGAENAANPAVKDLGRGLAARDVGLALATLQTLEDPVIGSRVQAACAAADATDALATLLARRSLPLKGVLGTVAIAGGAAAAGFYFSRQLAHEG